MNICVPDQYIEIDWKKLICRRPMRVSTREKFKHRRLRRRIEKELRMFCGVAITEDVRRQIARRLREMVK